LSEKAKMPLEARKIKGFKTSVQLMDKTDINCVKTERFQEGLFSPRNVSTEGFSSPEALSDSFFDLRADYNKSDLAIYTPENICYNQTTVSS
jgi:hypothetical protein